MTSTPPPLSDDARNAALQKAIAARRRQAEFKAALKRGEHPDIVATLVKCSMDDALCRLKVRVFMESLPGVGKIGAKRLMEEIGIADNRRIQGLGRQQRSDIAFRVRLVAGMK